MKILSVGPDSKIEHVKDNLAIAIGKFDGVHIGHKLLIDDLLKQKSKGYKTCIFTFNPTPAQFFGNADNKSLTTDSEKLDVLEQMGIDYVVDFPFNGITAKTEPEDFITDILEKELNVKYIAAGEDLSFGYKGRGNAKLLAEFAQRDGFEINIVPKIKDDGKDISSSLIRDLIEAGDVLKASKYLRGPYTFVGNVVHGNHIGNTIGFPTINVVPDKEKILPPNGVYFSIVSIEGDNNTYNAITNIGIKPTIGGITSPILETFIYDFDSQIYGKKVCVGLLERKRSEQKFDSIETLKKVLDRDINDGRLYFDNKRI